MNDSDLHKLAQESAKIVRAGLEMAQDDASHVIAKVIEELRADGLPELLIVSELMKATACVYIVEHARIHPDSSEAELRERWFGDASDALSAVQAQGGRH